MKQLFEDWRKHLAEDQEKNTRLLQVIGLLYYLSKDGGEKFAKFPEAAYAIENMTNTQNHKEVMSILEKISEIVKNASDKEKSAMLKLGKKWKAKEMQGIKKVRIQRSSGSTVTRKKVTAYDWELRG
tara:strand:- start:34 stop:414 length:381 start_codon:yes stop_codon:yes gene_type:complete